MTMIIDGTNGLTFNNATTQASAGQILQVVNATTSTQASSSNSTYVDTNLTATITPKFSTSKILVIVHQNGLRKTVASVDNSMGLKIVRNSTSICQIALDSFYTGTALGIHGQTLSTTYLDSPATTSATTYKTQFNDNSGTGSAIVQTDGASGGLSTITLMEIAQ